MLCVQMRRTKQGFFSGAPGDLWMHGFWFGTGVCWLFDLVLVECVLFCIFEIAQIRFSFLVRVHLC